VKAVVAHSLLSFLLSERRGACTRSQGIDALHVLHDSLCKACGVASFRQVEWRLSCFAEQGP